MLDYKNISSKIKESNLFIDSLYIEENNKLEKIIDSTDLHELRSCSKLLVAMALGIAIDKGLFSLDENVYNYLEKYITNENNIPKIKKWTIKTLLTHTTGYDKMIMSNKDIIENNISKRNLLEYVINYDIKNEPNKVFTYNNVEPFIISVLFMEKHNIDLEEYIKINIFDKINITNYNWKKYGKYCPGCTGLYLYPNDFYKLGKLIVNNGEYDGIQVIPSNWINEMIKIQIDTPNAYKEERLFPKVGAGYYVFISRDGYIFRDGTNGQYIIINKDKNLLITIMSSEKEMNKITEVFREML